MIRPTQAMGRLGTETAFEVLARANALEAEGRSIINLGIGQPDFDTPAHIVESAVKALRDGHHGYTPAAGIAELREAVSGHLLARYGIEVHPDRVVIVPGGKVTMFFAITMFGAPGVEILYPDPGFPIYKSVIDWSGATAVPVPLEERDGFALSAGAVLSRITPSTKLLILNSPANPTGGVTPKGVLDELVAGLEDHPHVAVLSDEIYSRILYDDHTHTTLLSYEALRDRLILLDGWSKTYAMTGWRLGFGVWPASLTESAIRLAVNTHSCVNAAAQHAGIAALTGSQDALDKMVAEFAQRRRAVVGGLRSLRGVSCSEPGGAFYAFPNVSATGLTARRLETGLLEEAGVATIAGTSFGAFGEGFIRLSYASSLERISEALDRIGCWLAETSAGGADR